MTRKLLFCLLVCLFAAGCELHPEEATPSPPAGATELPTLVITGMPEDAATPVIQPTATTLPLTSPTVVIAPPQITFTPIPPPPTAAPPSATPSVNGQVSQGSTGLRLRTEPNTSGRVIEQLKELTSLTILGRSGDSQWLNVVTDTGVIGWVMTQYVAANVDLNSLAVLDGSVPAANNQAPEVALAAGNAQVVAEGNGVRVRQLPSTNAAILGVLAEQTIVNVIGRTEDNSWLQVNINGGVQGWVFAPYLVGSFSISGLPIPAEAYEPTPAAFEAPSVNAASGALSGVNATAAQIYVTGQSYGNKNNVFSKVGDSITATGHFLIPIGWGQFSLRDYSYYSDVVSYFMAGRTFDNNPFAAASLAAKAGWSSSDVLNPGNAPVPPCNAGETPLVCEYRLSRPSIAIIMIGTNDMLNDTSTYQANLQTIVQTSINMGVIPVLYTIPPRGGWDAKIATYNQIIISTSQTYQVPLVDFYSALSKLPNFGMDPDGVHPSYPGSKYEDYIASGDFTAEHLQYGFPLRNLMTLQMLDAIWRQVIAPNPYNGPVTSLNTQALSVNPVPDNSAQAAPASSSGCPGTPTSRLTIGGLGRVTPGEPNNLRSAPSLAAAKLGEMPAGATFSVVAGPICADGLAYWQVNYNGTIGWTGEGKGSDYWLEPG